MALIDVNWKPGSRELRQFAVLFVIFAAVLGTVAYFFPDLKVTRHFPSWAPMALWIASGVMAFFALVLPKAALPIYVVMMAIALPIGMVVSTVLMLVIFFLVLTPVGLLMRAFGYDPMHRKLDKSASTYWDRA